jgi:hypothetical protein
MSIMNNQSIQTAADFSGNWWWCDFTRGGAAAV